MEIHPLIRNTRTVAEMFLGRAKASPALVAYEYQDREGIWHAVTYSEYEQLVRRAALGLHNFGIEKDSCVAIWGDTMPEWTVLDLGTVSLGAHVAGIYQTCTPDQAAYIINDSRATVLCADSYKRLTTILEIRDQIPHVTKFVVWGDDAPKDDSNITSLAKLIEEGAIADGSHPGLYEEMLERVDPETYAILVYTSGTTGPPKGVVLTNGNCVSVAINACEHADFFGEEDSTIAYLPLSHVAEYMGFLTRMICGVSAYFCPNFANVGDVLKNKQPTVLLGVPRVYEKVHQKIIGTVNSAPPVRKKIFYWAYGVGCQVVRLREAGKPIPAGLAVQHRLADRLVYSKVRAQLGGRVRMMFTAAAPIDPRIVEFFMAFGMTMLEAYGLSETSGASHINLPDNFRLGTVGLPIKGCEQMIAPDGEILLRSSAVFRGYLNRPDATAEAIDEDGWFHTGDIGEIDADGFLRITDRKKNLLITAGGKNVAPANIEVLIKREPAVSQAIVIGDRQPFLTTLVTINPDARATMGEEELEARIQSILDATNKEVARYEQIKKFRIVPREFTIEDEEMTPTMKLKRRVIMENWAHLVEDMYAGAEEAVNV
jgi:long-chain acyl-CoA synthetase